MTRKFDKCFDIVVGVEGGYVDDPNDKGGATKYGITIHTLRAWRYPEQVVKQDVKDLTLEEAKDIYREWYWKTVKCDIFPYELALGLFDGSINSGPVQASKWLQRALRVKDDGFIGPITVNAWMDLECNPDEYYEIIGMFFANRLMFLQNLEDFRNFGKGWFKRVSILCFRSGEGL